MGEDLDKSISHCTEALLLPFRTKPGSYVVSAMFFLAKALLFRSRELKQPGDVRYSIKYLCYLQDQSLETSNFARNEIKAFLVWSLAIEVELESIDPMRDIGEMATQCLELLTSGVEEPPLIHAVNGLANAICGTSVSFRQGPPDGAIECLREARIRLPDLEGVRFALVFSASIGLDPMRQCQFWMK